MSGKLLLIAIAAGVLLGVAPAAASAETDLPSPRGSVNDFAGRLSAREEAAISRRLDHYRRLSGHDLVVVTINAPVGPDYSDTLFAFWRKGRPTLENGLLLLIGDDGMIQAKIGGKLRPPLTKDVKEELTGPLDTSGGRREAAIILDRVNTLTAALERVPGETGSPMPPWLAITLAFFFFFSMLIIPWLSSIMARARPTYGGAYSGLMMAVLMTVLAGPGVGAAVLAFVTPIGYLMDRSISGHYAGRRSDGRSPAWWAGGERF